MADLATAKKSNKRPTSNVRRKSFANAAHRVGDAALMPLSAANNNVIEPATTKMAKSETVLKTRAVIAVVGNKLGDAVNKDKENITRAANTNLVRPVAKQIAHSEPIQKTKKAIGPAAKCMAGAAMMPISATNENVIAPLAKTNTVKNTRKAIVKTAGQVGEAFDKEHINGYVDKIVPATKKGAQTAMVPINATQTMIVQALSYDEEAAALMQQSRQAAAQEAPIAKTHMVSYAIASCEMRKMLLREELKAKKRKEMVKYQGKRDSSGGNNTNDSVDNDSSGSRKKARKAITATAAAANPTDVFVPRVVEETPAANLYEMPPRVLACPIRQSSISDFSEISFGTAGGGARAAAESNLLPLVVARSVDDDDDESNGLWEC